MLSAFGRFNQWGGGGGGGGGVDVSFRPIQSMWCPRSRQIQPVDGGCCPLSANSASGGAHVVNRGGGGGRHSVPKGGAMAPLAPPLGTPMLEIAWLILIASTVLYGIGCVFGGCLGSAPRRRVAPRGCVRIRPYRTGFERWAD